MQQAKKNINIVFLGYVDCGKSTLIGHLAYLSGTIDQFTIKSYEKQSIEMGKGSFKYAWVCDKLHEQRLRGITIKISLTPVYTKKNLFTLIDTPGHRAFIKNIITGISLSDVGILVISAALDQYEYGINSGSIIQDLLAYKLLVGKQLIICVNKLDTFENPQIAQKRFNQIKKETLSHLNSININQKLHKLKFIPISAWKGDNLTQKSILFPWYDGQTLIQALDSLQTINTQIQSKTQFRMIIHDSKQIKNVGTVILGKIISGKVNIGEKILIQPGNLNTQIKSIQMHGKNIKNASEGDYIGINVRQVNKNLIRRGMVFGSFNQNPPKSILNFTAKINILKISNKIQNGFCPLIYIHTDRITCKLKRIVSKLDKRTGKQIQKQPKFILSQQYCIVQMESMRSLCIQTYKNYPNLSKFIIRDQNKIIGFGIITQIQPLPIKQLKKQIKQK